MSAPQCAELPDATERWSLHIDFDPIEVQVEADPENQFPFDEGSRLIQFLGEEFFTLPEDLQECVSWNSTCVRISLNMLDPVGHIMAWVSMHSVPYQAILTREESRI